MHSRLQSFSKLLIQQRPHHHGCFSVFSTSIRTKNTVSEATQFSIEQQLEASLLAPSQGKVVDIRDRSACVIGLEDASVYSLVRFESSGMFGLCLSLEKNLTRIAPLGNLSSIQSGEDVSIIKNHNISESLLDLIVDKESMQNVNQRDVLDLFHAPPRIIDLELENQTIVTGIKMIDMFKPIQKGRNIAIAGEPGTGKRQFAADIAHLVNSGMYGAPDHVVWVSVGGDPHAPVLKDPIDPEKFTHFRASANKALVLQYLAPFAGVAFAESKREKGEHVLMVLDSVNSHGAVFESLMTSVLKWSGQTIAKGTQPLAPVLERCGQIKSTQGAITCLALLDTDESVHSDKAIDYLHTITDSTIKMDAKLSNIRSPAINPSKLGLHSLGQVHFAAFSGLTQKLQRLMFEIGTKVRNIGLAEQFGFKPEYEADSDFYMEYYNTLCELFNQSTDRRDKTIVRVNMETEFIILFASAHGYLEQIPGLKVREYETTLVQHLQNTNKKDGNASIYKLVSDSIDNGNKTLSPGIEIALEHEIHLFTEEFVRNL